MGIRRGSMLVFVTATLMALAAYDLVDWLRRREDA